MYFMVRDIFNYWDKEIGAYNLIFKHMKIEYFCVFITLAMFILGAVNALITERLIVIAIFLLLMFASIFFFNKKAKKILNSKHGIIIKSWIWNGDLQFYEKKDQLFKEHLYEKNLFQSEKLTTLSRLLYKDAEDNRFKGFFSVGILLAFLIPIWSEFIRLLMLEISSDKHIFLIGIGISVITVIIIYMVASIKGVILDIVDRKANKMKQLARTVEEFLLEFN